MDFDHIYYRAVEIFSLALGGAATAISIAAWQAATGPIAGWTVFLTNAISLVALVAFFATVAAFAAAKINDWQHR